MISAIILAGGTSTRMGESKQLLPFGDRTVIETIADTLLATKVDEVVVVLGHLAEEIAGKISDRPVRTAVNPDYRDGMLSSVKRGIRSVEGAEAVLICLVDQPDMSAGVIDGLIEAYWNSPKGIVIPVYRGRRGHPVVVGMRYKEEILQLDDQIGLRGLMRAHPEDILEVEVWDERVLHDMDTREAYLEALKRLTPPGRSPTLRAGGNDDRGQEDKEQGCRGAEEQRKQGDKAKTDQRARRPIDEGKEW